MFYNKSFTISNVCVYLKSKVTTLFGDEDGIKDAYIKLRF